MSTQGGYRKDGTWIGFDYEQQAWIDTSPACQRDATAKPGSASNPLRYRNPVATCTPEVLDWLDPTGGLQRAGLMRKA